MRTNRLLKRALCAALSASFVLTVSPDASVAQSYRTAPPRPATGIGQALYTEKLPGDREATVYASGVAQIRSRKQRTVEYRLLSGAFNRYLKQPDFRTDKLSVAAQLAVPHLPVFVPGRVLVVFRDGVGVSKDTFSLPASTVAKMRTARTLSYVPSYTSDSRVNTAFAKLGVDAYERIGRSLSRGKVEALRAVAASRRTAFSASGSGLSIENAYRVHLTGSTVVNAVRTLRALPGVAYAAPDYTVRTMNTPGIPISADEQKQAVVRRAMGAATPPSYKLPSNYALAASAQPMLNARGVDAAAAYDEVFRRYGQLPGQGVTITNVSIGDLDDASAVTMMNDPCQPYAGRWGPTTRVIAGQRYLDLPSMPLIPAYAATPDGTLSGSAEVCGADPLLGEVGLDFSVMAPLPHDQQRGGSMGTGFTDLLGIAPGANYRLVVPQSSQPSVSDILGAFLGAANQSPAPDVITASLGFGMDAYGFPGRYFEDDPLVSSVISNIVNGQNIVVVISANDGMREYTNASIGPSGGSAPTNLATDPSQLTTLDDVALSTVPSVDSDSGAIDVGSTTLDDVSAFNPLDPANAGVDGAVVPETRYTGFSGFSSGFGSRVNLSAPGDNIVALSHMPGGNFSDVSASLNGGTSASAPEAAAAAAVVLQVARLSGHPFAKATDVRTLLEQTANPVMQTPQTDQPLNVGPRVDVARAVEKLLGATGLPVKPGVPRVAVMQRRSGGFNLRGAIDTAFVGNTDPAYIDLAGPFDPWTQQNSGENAYSYITIAPDWEGLPSGTKFALTVNDNKTPLATSASARLLPAQILSAAGMPLASSTQRTVTLTYRAYQGLHNVVSTTFQLTFGPAQATSELVQAPVVAPVVTGQVMTVSYDFSAYPPGMLSSPAIMVSFPGRTNTATGNLYFASYMAPIAAGSTKGTVTIPVNALPGDGLYGVQLVLNRFTGAVSDYSPVRVATMGNTRAPAPMFLTSDPSTGTQVRSHYLETGYNGSFTISYDVSSVPHATGALLEISAPGNNLWGNRNPFNNPNGSVLDYNHLDTGSVYQQMLYGTKGQVTLKESDAHLVAGLNHVVRVIPMNGGLPAGEASDVSYIAEDGVYPDDGGSLYDGYGINPQGNDGVLTSYQWLADGVNVLKSVQRFSQDTVSAGTVLASDANGCNAYFNPGNAVFGGDTAVVMSWNAWGYLPYCKQLYPITYSSIPNLADATGIGSAFTPPLATPTNIVFATSSISGAPTGKGAFLTLRWDMAYGGNDFSAQTFLGDVSKNTFSTPIDIDSLNLFDSPIYGTMDYDSAANKGYILVDQLSWFGWHSPTSILAADYGAGTASTFPVNQCTQSLDFEVDPSTHEAAMSCFDSTGLQFVNLTSQTTQTTSLPSAVALSNPTMVSVDPVNHLFFAEVPLSGDVSYNNNTLSSVVEFDESGNIRTQIEAFNFLFSVYGNHFFEVNPALRRGFVFGPEFSEIQPFSY